MLNQIVLVGRLVKDVELEKEGDLKQATLSLAIPRSWKNAEGLYDTDFVDCKIFDSVASNTSEHCHKGDIVGIKGRIQTDKIENKYQMTIIAEKVSFLSSKKGDNENE